MVTSISLYCDYSSVFNIKRKKSLPFMVLSLRYSVAIAFFPFFNRVCKLIYMFHCLSFSHYLSVFIICPKYGLFVHDGKNL